MNTYILFLAVAWWLCAVVSGLSSLVTAVLVLGWVAVFVKYGFYRLVLSVEKDRLARVHRRRQKLWEAYQKATEEEAEARRELYQHTEKEKLSTASRSLRQKTVIRERLQRELVDPVVVPPPDDKSL